MKQPDAFERMVDKVDFSWPCMECGGSGNATGASVVRHRDVVNLLRRHHAKIERMVRHHSRVTFNHDAGNNPTPYEQGWYKACASILEQLKAMRRGK